MSDEHTKGNGQAQQDSGLVDRLELIYDRATGTLAIGGQVVNSETAVEICHRAMTHFENIVRIAAARRAQAELASGISLGPKLPLDFGRRQ